MEERVVKGFQGVWSRITFKNPCDEYLIDRFRIDAARQKSRELRKLTSTPDSKIAIFDPKHLREMFHLELVICEGCQIGLRDLKNPKKNREVLDDRCREAVEKGDVYWVVLSVDGEVNQGSASPRSPVLAQYPV